jgi:phosphoglucosamine mutase
MSLRFGTDGIRGVANIDLTPEFALRLGRALAANLPPGPVLIGRDSRLSGEMLEGALVAGLLSAGRSVVSAGILPTPALALLTRMSEAVLGVMISASHNPIEDNGFKCFDALGFKLADEIERSIEDELLRAIGPPSLPDSHPTLRRDPSLVNLYIDAITSLGVALNGYTVVIDAAFGAAYATAPEAFRALGARVVSINGEADGSRINVRCGATDLGMLAEEVRRIGGSRTVGVAFDGDADRVRFVDERGESVEGDAILLVMARDLKERGALAGDVVIGTLMSNVAFERRLEAEGMRLLRTPVGDRYVLQAMRERGANFGGEPSGHIIDLRRNTTGDGPAAAIALLSLLARKDTTLSALVADYEPYPQILLNVRLPEGGKQHEDPQIVAAVMAAQALLGGEGRILIRPSGTEPLMRVMVEGRDAEQIRVIAEDLAESLRALER